jgi:rod shape-determining protein MreD
VRRVAAIFALVFGAPMVQGALAPFLPTAFRPDLALLVVFALALSWRNTATGVVLAAICGFVVDLFSGALLGQHALLSVLAFMATRAISVHVSMIGALPQMIGALPLTAVHAVGVVGLTAFFTPGAEFALPRLWVLLPRVAVNSFAAPAVYWVVAGLVSWVAGEDLSRRPLRIATRGSWVP